MAAGGGGRAALRQKTAEIAMALAFLAIGAIVIFDSLRLGARWGDEGPQAGYFPFYIALIICVSAAMILFRALRLRPEQDKAFVGVEQLKLVLAVLVPTAVYVALIGWLGIYVASTAFIAFFMRWLGKYVWWKVAATSVGTSVFFFLIFEIWFKIPLPKGPLETLLRLN